ncbi:hypothetical protein H8S90_05420 [Olivibacter sp. SDN3]|uniref:hypothetical protein n=1 Tax=Olivibacter sp. SDN3 TaxID=2764720 RepID=UPI00165131A7|nr:hypothetical protein [Olivibacter sp. SDN3]QNL51031.1 hypothetical protein H8S90_05420 [Olivibacter sp. SDN3]
MNRFKSIFAGLVGLSVVMLFYYLLKPIEITKENSIEVQSVVWKVNEGGLGDYIVELQGRSGMYFISKIHSQHLNIDSLSKTLTGQQVSVSYLKPKALTNFGPMIGKKQITKLMVDNMVVFSAL